MIPDMPIDFQTIAVEGVTIAGAVLAAVAGIIIVIALVRMGVNFFRETFSGDEIPVIRGKYGSGDRSNYETIVKDNEGRLHFVFTGDYPDGGVYYFNDHYDFQPGLGEGKVWTGSGWDDI